MRGQRRRLQSFQHSRPVTLGFLPRPPLCRRRHDTGTRSQARDLHVCVALHIVADMPVGLRHVSRDACACPQHCILRAGNLRPKLKAAAGSAMCAITQCTSTSGGGAPRAEAFPRDGACSVTGLRRCVHSVQTTDSYVCADRRRHNSGPAAEASADSCVLRAALQNAVRCNAVLCCVEPCVLMWAAMRCADVAVVCCAMLTL